MKPQTSKKFFSLLGSATLFLTIAVIVMIAVLVYAAANESFGGNNGAISLIMLTVIVFFSFACILIDGIRRKITVNRPVERILEATERIASGDFSVRLEPSHSYGRYNEFDRIMENLNRMAAELSKKRGARRGFRFQRVARTQNPPRHHSELFHGAQRGLGSGDP